MVCTRFNERLAALMKKMINSFTVGKEIWTMNIVIHKNPEVLMHT